MVPDSLPARMAPNGVSVVPNAPWSGSATAQEDAKQKPATVFSRAPLLKPRSQEIKSFLLLFFRKEISSFSSPFAEPITVQPYSVAGRCEGGRRFAPAGGQAGLGRWG